VERRLFSAPYESKDCQQKFEWFLPRFAAVLQDPESGWEDWQQEYTQVGGGSVLLCVWGERVLVCCWGPVCCSLWPHRGGIRTVLPGSSACSAWLQPIPPVGATSR
jgi:hypothetical protein